MIKELALVWEWHQKFEDGRNIHAGLQNMSDERIDLRVKLIQEEAAELCAAMKTRNEVEAMDGICDLLYVVFGAALDMGFEAVLENAFREVHRSNMSKLGEDGKPILRKDGKILKGPNFSPPNLHPYIMTALFLRGRKMSASIGAVPVTPDEAHKSPDWCDEQG